MFKFTYNVQTIDKEMEQKQAFNFFVNTDRPFFILVKYYITKTRNCVIYNKYGDEFKQKFLIKCHVTCQNLEPSQLVHHIVYIFDASLSYIVAILCVYLEYIVVFV